MAGSIEKRGKNSYRLIVSEGYDLHGKPLIHRKTVHGTKKEAEVELAKFVTEVQNGLVIDGKALRFSEFVEIWKKDYEYTFVHFTQYFLNYPSTLRYLLPSIFPFKNVVNFSPFIILSFCNLVNCFN